MLFHVYLIIACLLEKCSIYFTQVLKTVPNILYCFAVTGHLPATQDCNKINERYCLCMCDMKNYILFTLIIVIEAWNEESQPWI